MGDYTHPVVRAHPVKLRGLALEFLARLDADPQQATDWYSQLCGACQHLLADELDRIRLAGCDVIDEAEGLLS